MSTVTIRNTLSTGLQAIGPRLRAEALRQLYEGAEAIMAASQEAVPVRNRLGGTLRGSAYVRPPMAVSDTLTVIIMGYGGAAAKYAEAVHENPRAGRTGGVSPSGRRYRSWAEVGGWKFLEVPFARMAPEVIARVRLA